MKNSLFFSIALLLGIIGTTSLPLTPPAHAQSIGESCTAAQEGKSACHQNGCYKCESLQWKPQSLIHGATSDTCLSTRSGLVQWTGTSLQYCNGTAWTALATDGASNNPVAFSFTNQEGQTANTTISSNEITLVGFTGTATATCGTGCTAISRNGIWIGPSVTGFYAGDKIAIRQTSSASANTTTTTSVTIGGTTSNAWRVTTGYVNSFGFTNQTGVNLNTTISSNAVALSGNFTNWTANCGTNCTAIAKDGVWGSTSVAGFNPGNTIAIRLTSANAVNTAKTATVSVGPSTSNTWSVTTTNDACIGSPSPGTVCADGRIFAGNNPYDFSKMYTTPCDAGMSGTKGSCSGTRPSYTQGTYGVYNMSGGIDVYDGRNNMPRWTGSDVINYCANLVAYGNSDWYLPARYELGTLYGNSAAIGGFLTTFYWTSEEYNEYYAQIVDFSSGTHGQTRKDSNYLPFRCLSR